MQSSNRGNPASSSSSSSSSASRKRKSGQAAAIEKRQAVQQPRLVSLATEVFQSVSQTARIQTLEAKLTEAQVGFSQSKLREAASTTVIEGLHTKVERIEKEKSDLQTQLEKAKTDLRNSECKHNAEMQTALQINKRNQAVYETSMESYRNRLAQTSNALTQAQAAFQSVYSSQAAEKDYQIACLQARLHEQTACTETYRREITSYLNTMNNYSVEVDSLVKQTRLDANNIAKLQQEINRLQTQLAEGAALAILATGMPAVSSRGEARQAATQALPVTQVSRATGSLPGADVSRATSALVTSSAMAISGSVINFFAAPATSQPTPLKPTALRPQATPEAEEAKSAFSPTPAKK